MSTTAAAVKHATALRRSAAVQLACMGQFQAKQIQQETDELPTLMSTAPTSCVCSSVRDTRLKSTCTTCTRTTQTAALHVANYFDWLLTLSHTKQ